MEMEKCEVKKIAGPIEGGAAIFIGNEKKTFMIFVGLFEASAIVKEISGQQSIRPLTHDLLHNIVLGFDIEVKRVIISSIVDNTFCATLVLEQSITENGDQKKKEVQVDARASDSIILALKTQKEIWVAPDVFEKAEDVSSQILDSYEQEKKNEWQVPKMKNFEFEIPDFLPEDEDEDSDL